MFRRMLLAAAFIGPLISAADALANTLTFRLLAVVEPVCEVRRETSLPAPGGTRIRLDLDCNLERYGLRLATPDGAARVLSAQGVGVVVAVEEEGRVAVRSLAPGRQRIDLLVAQPPNRIEVAAAPGPAP